MEKRFSLVQGDIDFIGKGPDFSQEDVIAFVLEHNDELAAPITFQEAYVDLRKHNYDLIDWTI